MSILFGVLAALAAWIGITRFAGFLQELAKERAMQEIRKTTAQQRAKLEKELDQITKEIQDAKINYANSRKSFRYIEQQLGGSGVQQKDPGGTDGV